MKHIIKEQIYESNLEEDMFFPDVIGMGENKNINDTYYPGKKCAYSDKNGKCILGNDYKKCIHKKAMILVIIYIIEIKFQSQILQIIEKKATKN